MDTSRIEKGSTSLSAHHAQMKARVAGGCHNRDRTIECRVVREALLLFMATCEQTGYTAVVLETSSSWNAANRRPNSLATSAEESASAPAM